MVRDGEMTFEKNSAQSALAPTLRVLRASVVTGAGGMEGKLFMATSSKTRFRPSFKIYIMSVASHSPTVSVVNCDHGIRSVSISGHECRDPLP